MGCESLEGVNVSGYLLRYVVPFSYDDKTDEDGYAYAVRKLKEAKWTLEKRTQAESECYDYLKSIYTMAEDDKENSNVVGSIWGMPEKNKKGVSISFRQDVIVEGEKRKNTTLKGKISKAGIYLFKNKVGLFWYEVEPDSENYKITLDLLVEFQNRFKELASRGNGIQIELAGEFEVDKRDILSENDKRTPHYLVSLSPGENRQINGETGEKSFRIAKKAIINGVDFLKSESDILFKSEEERNAGVSAGFLKATTYSRNGEECLKLKYNIMLSTSKLGVWINRKLAALDCEISYYPGRKDTVETVIPDKALLFNYIAVAEEEFKVEEKNEALKYAAYYLTKGYKKTYHPAKDFEAEMKYPFENILWYAQREGCGLYISFDKENEGFLKDGMKDRVSRDYFHLYMSLLQQSYILLKFSEEIASTISTDKDEYRNPGTEVGKKLEDLQLRINLFLMKNIYASVGFTSQHNQFYTYVEQVLNIKEDIDALNSGMGTLEELLRRKKAEQRALEKAKEEEKSDRMQTAFAVLSVLSVLSLPKTLTEFFGLDIVECVEMAEPYAGISLVIIYIATLLLFVFVLKQALPVLIKLFSNQNKSKDQQEKND